MKPMNLLEARLGDGREMKVEFTETPEGIEIRETFDAEGMNPVEMQRMGWQAILDSFARHVVAKQAG